MKKLFAVAITGILLASGVIPSYADYRLELSSSRQTVVTGTSTSLSLSSQAGEANFSNLKYQLVLPENQRYEIRVATTQWSSAFCRGATVGIDSSLRNCVETVADGNSLVFAGGISNAVAGKSKITLTSLSDNSFPGSVRAWVDSNNNSIVEPFEPRSDFEEIAFISTAEMAVFSDFRVDPLLLNAKSATAWLSSSSGFDSAGEGLTQIVDTTLFQASAFVCDRDKKCKTISGTRTEVSHPQILSSKFEFAGVTSLDASVEFILFYTLPNGEVVEIDKHTIRGGSPDLSVLETQTSGPGLTAYNWFGKPIPEYFERWKQLTFSNRTFNYSLTVLAQNGAPRSNQLVPVRIDASLLRDSTNLRIDGRRLTPVHRDQIWIQRRTDSKGQITIKFENLLPYDKDSIAIEPVLDGLRPWENRLGGKSERVHWISAESSRLTLGANFNSSTGLLTVTANVLTPSGPELRKQTVLFDVDQPLQIGQSVVNLGGYSKVGEYAWTAAGSTTVKISNLAIGNGSATLRARVRSGTKTLVASIPINWDAQTGQLRSSAPSSAAIGVSILNSRGKLTIRVTNGADSAIEIQAFDKTYLVTPDSNNFSYPIAGKSGLRTTVTVYVDGNLALVSSQQLK